MADEFYTPEEFGRRLDCLEKEWADELVQNGMPAVDARRKASDMIAVFDLVEGDDQGRVRRRGLDLSKY